MHDLKGPILIAGGGIGGLTAAIALRRAGFDVQVFERAAEIRELGAGIAIEPNAVLALRRIGLDGAVTAAGCIEERLELRTAGGSSETWGHGHRFGIVPIGHGRVYWYATSNAPRGGRDKPGEMDSPGLPLPPDAQDLPFLTLTLR